MSGRTVRPGEGPDARGGCWYLVARDLDCDDWRTFRADRIIPRTPGGGPLTPRRAAVG